jgi:hypothetical protein
MSKFKIEITSVPDREKLVAEIWYCDNLIAEINQESDDYQIEIYPSGKLIFSYEDFLEALKNAKNRLKE